MKPQFTAHPWHGISQPEEFPEILQAFIEIVPGDTVKYEIDKGSGYLKIDRPQKFSNIVPALYGFLPQTFSGELSAEFAASLSSLPVSKGDGDPLDILVLSERQITHGNVLLHCRPVGGFRLIDDGEADDKIIAVLKDDALYGKWRDITDCPDELLNRLKHYFLTYKNLPGENPKCVLSGIYGVEEAKEVIRRSRRDYELLQL